MKVLEVLRQFICMYFSTGVGRNLCMYVWKALSISIEINITWDKKLRSQRFK